MVITPAPDNLFDVQTPEHFQELLSKDLQRVSLINFWASWAEPCRQMNQVVSELARRYPEVEADALQDISESFEIEAVPSFIVLRGHTLLSRINGADAQTLTSALTKHARTSPAGQAQTNRFPQAESEEETEDQLVDRMQNIMQQSRVVLFMKGSPDSPRCGFSRQTVAILREHDVEFTHFDILEDEAVRQGILKSLGLHTLVLIQGDNVGLKTLNNWPTFPQLIVNGEFIGGLDIIKEAVETGEFHDLVKV
ncbi:hypothetical protein Clacol_002858 [Clathrus columnatus]|uniref:Glutaredoxin n=1 Tax=Clathrus columnatus TaxID=1419009 RepID=A0AAV5A1Y0_9AGAM|nr:hypothetical protein Clacol_002858 [Clathrus columnatus]